MVLRAKTVYVPEVEFVSSTSKTKEEFMGMTISNGLQYLASINQNDQLETTALNSNQGHF